MKSNKPILLVEDDQIDVKTIKRALKELHITNNLIVAGNGEEALLYLQNDQNERPHIILLDLNMPRMNGFEFLQIAKQDKKLKAIPVIVLTTSKEEQDKVDSFNLHIAGYMLKPVNYLQFVEVVRTIDLYWTLSELPEE
jgi:Response regulators consisting of a CheY-like receiver domain and a winged-helix DNA-binding domain